MTTTPDRSINGLARRPKPDASRLIAANRPTPAEEPVQSAVTERPPAVVPEPSPVAPAEAPAQRPVTGRPAVAPKPSPVAPADTAGPDPHHASVKVSVYLPKDVRRAAVAAFKATAHLEDDQSWSDMIEKAVRAEVKRRERAHNGGKPFPGGEGKLTPGRSVSV